jgi:hypothetical protein
MPNNLYTDAQFTQELLFQGVNPGDWQYVGAFDETDTKEIATPILATDGIALPNPVTPQFIAVFNFTSGTNYDFSVFGYINDGAASGNVTGWYLIYTVDALTASAVYVFTWNNYTYGPFYPKITRVYISENGGDDTPVYDCKVYVPARV